MAPILPYLAEEIHYTARGGRDDKATTSSVFMRKWTPLVSYFVCRIIYWEFHFITEPGVGRLWGRDGYAPVITYTWWCIVSNWEGTWKQVCFPLDGCKTVPINRKLCNRQLKSSLEAEVDLVLPSDTGKASPVLELLQREGMPSLSNLNWLALDLFYFVKSIRGFPEDTVHRIQCCRNGRRFLRHILPRVAILWLGLDAW